MVINILESVVNTELWAYKNNKTRASILIDTKKSWLV